MSQGGFEAGLSVGKGKVSWLWDLSSVITGTYIVPNCQCTCAKGQKAQNIKHTRQCVKLSNFAAGFAEN